MTWQDIQGHDRIIEQFRRALRNGRLASSFLFVGPPGIGKFSFAVKLAQALLCESVPEEQLEPCGTCPACQQVAARTHPDLEVVSKPKDRNYIPVELFIGDREHRMREGLCHNIGLKPFRGGRKIAIIDDADFLNQEGANCLLKTLEEPPPKSMIILIGSSEQKQLPTIRSRCQIIRFRALPEETVAELLVRQELVEDRGLAARLAALSGGSLETALQLADEQLGELRQMLLTELSRPNWDAVELSKVVGQFVDDAGKEAPARRVRMNQLIGFSADFYRQLMRAFSGLPVEGDDVLGRSVAAAQGAWVGDATTAAACLQRCLEAQGHILANVNQANLLDSWLDDLAVVTRTGSDGTTNINPSLG
jgi:DNA polymerase-3 subunit delta'